KVDDGYKLIPNSNIQTFNVVAEDGTSIKYSVTFNEEVEKETITSVEVEQGETRYTAKGPDENNQFTVEEFDKSKGEGVKIKYKTSSGEEKETGVFVPNSDNNNTGMLYVKNNTYTVLFKEKENVPDESTETIPNDGGGNGGGSVVGGGGSPTDDNNTPVTPVTCDGNLNKSIKTKGSNVNIRNEASTANGSKSIIESVADSGTKLSAVKEEGEWYMVKLPSDNTKCGWISKTVIENSNTGKGFDCDTSKLDHYMVTGTNANYSDLNTNVISKRNQGVKVYGELCSTTKNETNKKQCQVIADKYKRKLENWYIVKYNDEKNKCGFMYKDQLTEYNKGVAKIALDRCSNNKTLIDSWIKANKSSSKRTKVKDEYLTNMTINSKPLYNYIKYNNADQNSFWLQAGFFKSDYEKTWSKIHLINVLALERGSNTGNIEYLLTYGTLPGTIKSTFNEDVQGYRVHEVIAQCVNNLFKAAKNKGNSNSDSGSQSLLACCNSPKNKDIFLRTETYVSITCYADFDLDIDASDKALCK
ncbi:MAG: hypothetical protein IJO32_06245, partial [Bacilli bacterium]|nr:hypothetical protein [Bacilli bacterium]